MMPTLVSYLYILAAALFVLSLKWMNEVKTSRWGNWAGSAGMLIAIVATILACEIHHYGLLILAILVGTIVGVPIALKLPMTAVPQRTAMSHAFGSLAVALIGTAEYFQRAPNIDTFTMAVLSTEMILGYLTFTGSSIAFAKLQELISGKPVVYPGKNFVSILVLAMAFATGIVFVMNPGMGFLLPIMAFLALVFGFLLVMGIGGADMPTVIAILNAYAGLSAAALGFVLNNKLLIVAGTLDGSSGFILAILMCKAMNRSFINVLFGGVGAVVASSGSNKQAARSVQSYSPQDFATVLTYARHVVVVPGYGMAVSQAHHAVKELENLLEAQGVDVKYAIHPVAGRMPGHMNVLLAEANISYDKLWDLDQINPLWGETDVAIVVGANDVVNPVARTDPASPIYGMPILDVDKARTVVVIKRSMAAGFAGIENELFYLPKTMMVFGDAKQVISQVVAVFKSTH